MRLIVSFSFYRWAFVLCTLACFSVAWASETDQYSTLLLDLKDVGKELDWQVNIAISEIAYNWQRKPDSRRFALKLAAFFNRRQVEYWSAGVLKPYTWRSQDQGIYRQVSLEDSRLIAMGGVAATMNVHGTQIGSDKITHFFGVGLLYFLKTIEPRFSQLTPMAKIAKAVEFGAYSEKTLWGMVGTGVFSNADLAANFDGMRFYLNLFEKDFATGRPPLLRWKDGKPEMQRYFTFKDYVTPYWNEAILANKMSCPVQKTLQSILYSYCKNPQYAKAAKLNNVLAIKSPYNMAGFEFDNYFSVHDACERARENRTTVCRVPETKFTNDFLKQAISMVEILQSENTDSMSILKEGIAQVMGEGFEQAPLAIGLKPIISLPGCQPIVQKAKNEYAAFLDTLKKNDVTVREFVRLGLRLGVSKKATQEITRRQPEASLTFQDSPSHRHGVMQRLCLNFPVNPQDYAEQRFNPSSEITARVCLHQDSRQGHVVRLIQYDFKNQTRQLVSLRGYFQWDDEEAYIFRTIPRLCSGLTILQPTQEQSQKLNVWLPKFLLN